jgi:hypothetical protein
LLRGVRQITALECYSHLESVSTFVSNLA